MVRRIKTSVTGVLVELLKKHSIRHIFGLPSAQLGMFMDAVSRDDHFTYVTSRHEECAGHMAHGANIPAGDMALCFATVGPGATNLLPGVAAASANNIPMIVLTANNPLAKLDPYVDMLQAADQIALFRPFTKWSAQLRDSERAGELIERALRIARSGRPGPVHLDLPTDISTKTCIYDLDAEPLYAPARPVPSADELANVIELLRNAKRPLLVAGGGVVRSGATAAFRSLAERQGFAAISSIQGWGVVSPDRDEFVGSPGWWGGNGVLRAGREADVVLAVGCKFGSWTPVAKPPTVPIPEGQKIIHVDIDDSMLGKNAPVHLGLVGDARETLRAIDTLLPRKGLAADPAWVLSLAETRRQYAAQVDKIADQRPKNGARQAMPAFMRELARLVPDDAIVCVDGGQTSTWAMTFFKPKGPHLIKFDSGMGHMGAGLPMAVGAKAVAPRDQLVVVVAGDGAAGLTSQELETAARKKLKVVMVVMNDSAWGCYRPLQDVVFENDKLGPDLTDVDFSAVAKAYGCDGESISDANKLQAAFGRALASAKPYVINAMTAFALHPLDHEYWGPVIMPGVDMRPHSIEPA